MAVAGALTETGMVAFFWVWRPPWWRGCGYQVAKAILRLSEATPETFRSIGPPQQRQDNNESQ